MLIGTDQKLQKIKKVTHCLNVNMMLSSIVFLIFVVSDLLPLT